MSEYYKTLIHPKFSIDYAFEEQIVWNRWIDRRKVFIVGPDYPLEDVSYLDIMPAGTHVVYGGMITHACVADHLYHVGLHPRVTEGELHIELSRRATFGDGHEELIRYIKIASGIDVKLRP